MSKVNLVFQKDQLVDKLPNDVANLFNTTPDHVKKLVIEIAAEQIIEDPTMRFYADHYDDDFNETQTNYIAAMGDAVKPALYSLHKPAFDEMHLKSDKMLITGAGIDHVGNQMGVQMEEIWNG